MIWCCRVRWRAGGANGTRPHHLRRLSRPSATMPVLGGRGRPDSPSPGLSSTDPVTVFRPAGHTSFHVWFLVQILQQRPPQQRGSRRISQCRAFGHEPSTRPPTHPTHTAGQGSSWTLGQLRGTVEMALCSLPDRVESVLLSDTYPQCVTDKMIFCIEDC